MPNYVEYGVVGALLVITGMYTTLTILMFREHKKIVEDFLRIIGNHMDHATRAIDNNSEAIEKNVSAQEQLASIINIQQKFCKCLNIGRESKGNA